MSKKAMFFVAICFLFSGSTAKSRTVAPTRFTYPELFRDHVHYSLSDRGKEQFYSIDIHPDCKAKHGHCIPRAKCTGKEMLYISRVCYNRDLVCCYDNSIRFPVTAGDTYTAPTKNMTTESYVEPPVLP